MPVYEHVDAAVLRATAHPLEAGTRWSWPGASGEAGLEEWCTWIAQVWASESVARAVAFASPALAEQIESMPARREPDLRQVRRTALALARYLVRVQGRATPFGLFAGVSAVRFGHGASVRWSGHDRVRARADAVWLADVIARFESCPQLRLRLPVVVNDLATVRGERLLVTWQPHTAAQTSGSQEEVSVRLVPVVETILRFTRTPIRVGDLIGKIAAEHPGPASASLEAVVGELMTRGVLISGLRPPATEADALAHLLARLREVEADRLSEVRHLVGELHFIHQALQRAESAKPYRQGHTFAQRMRQVSSAADQPLAVDLRLDCSAVLPVQVAHEAASAAAALVRLAPQTPAVAAWNAYRGRFLDRYGPGALVPVKELTDPLVGLGFPQHFTQPATPAGVLSRRDERLLVLAQQAALDGVQEIRLDDAALDALTGVGSVLPGPAAHGDVWVDVRASSTRALAEGFFTLGVSGFGRTAANAGRFLDLFSDADRRRMTEAYGRLPPGVQDGLVAQLSFPPRTVRSENVLRVPPVVSHVISLAEHRDPAPGQIPLRDLAVTADRDRMYVVSLSRRRVVEPILPHAGARHTMPHLARLLFEIPRSAHAPVTSFDWGAAAVLPFLPRVRYGRSILAPAQWDLNPAGLPSSSSPMSAWTAALDTARERRNLPANISVGTTDRQLRLDLDDPVHLAVLRAHVDSADGPVTVREAPTVVDYGWLQGRAHEIVIPLAATAPPAPTPTVLTSAAPLPLTPPQQCEDVVLVKVYGHPEVFDAILLRHVPALLERWDVQPLWWFTRSRQGSPHLRLRLRDPDLQRAHGYVGAWAAQLRRLGLIGDLTFSTYHPEVARYGPGAAMQAAHAVFAADSHAVLTQLAALTGARDVQPSALTAASLVDLTHAMTGGTPSGMRWLIDHPEIADGAAALDREARRQTLLLANAWTLLTLPGGPEIAAAWRARSEAAARYASCLTPEITRVTPASALTSLLHMHHNRARGIDPAGEAASGKLARAAALARAARQTGTGSDR
ncbi:lantibiotic dehydratase [Actinacidiphila sp. bgisy145]|uniref:lantibiotic dehydratase n=1 Tax=Actinacidiphila sp. bgisy145 TaxID=3413792 RepID=UPI003EBC0DEC